MTPLPAATGAPGASLPVAAGVPGADAAGQRAVNIGVITDDPKFLGIPVQHPKSYWLLSPSQGVTGLGCGGVSGRNEGAHGQVSPAWAQPEARGYFGADFILFCYFCLWEPLLRPCFTLYSLLALQVNC